MTYSILGRDPRTGLMGAAVASHYLAVGAHVPWARAGTGLVATQADLRMEYGPAGLDLMAGGSSAADALTAALAADDRPEVRQVAMLDAAGRTAAHTGTGCWRNAAHVTAPDVAAQANLVASDRIPGRMVEAFRDTGGDLADRLLAALDAAEALGGDLRGRQSAALVIVESYPATSGDTGVVTDLRVDDDDEPIGHLRHLVDLARAARLMRAHILGAACRGPQQPTPDESRSAIAALEEVQRAYGDGNREPDFWRAVALWRGGDPSAARALIAELGSERAGWRVLFADVTGRWRDQPDS